MRRVLRKVKSQWAVLGIMGATVIALGAAEVPQVSADEIEGATASESVAGNESGTGSEALDASENAAQRILQESENSTNSVTLSAVTESTEPQTTNEISEEIPAVDEVDYATILSTTTVDYSAVISRATDAINTAPWGVKDYQTVGSSADYPGKTVEVTKEQVTDYGVTWALVSLDGKELGWIAKDALKVQTYAAIVSEKAVDYPATITRGTDAINRAPWGTKGFQTIASSAAYVGKTVEVTKEQTTDYGVTWALVSLDGKELGWIAKDALRAQTYAAIVSEKTVEYSATINRATDAINKAPWGTKGFQTIASSTTYVGKTVEITKEQTTDYGVTWAQISLNGEVLGWVAKDALKIQAYAQITKETAVSYDAIVKRDSDAINTAPWGVKGFQTLSSSAAYVGQTVEVTKEQTTDYGVTWALVSLNGKELGWVAKDALSIKTYAKVVSEKAVAYDAKISRGTDAINTAPWGTKGYTTVVSSAGYVGKTVAVSKEQVTDYGVTWALVTLDGKELGWIAKDALKVQTYAQIVKETAVDYYAIIKRGTDAINSAPWGIKGYQTVGSSADYPGKTVKVSKEQVTDYGVTWVLVSLDGKELGWIAKEGLNEPVDVNEVRQEVRETAIPYQTINNTDENAYTDSIVKTVGLNGVKETTYEVTYEKGVKVGETVVNENVVKTPVNEVTTTGTKAIVTTENITKTSAIAYETVTFYATRVAEGETVVQTEGHDGVKTTVMEVTFNKGIEILRKLVSETVVTAPVKKVVLIGIKAPDFTEVQTVKTTILHTTRTDYDTTKEAYFKEIKQEGEDGIIESTYNETYVNGIRGTRVLVSTTIIKEMVPEIIVRGGRYISSTFGDKYTIKENEVDFPIRYTDNTELEIGVENIISPGSKGYDLVSYYDELVDGVKVDTLVASRKTIKPINQIVEVGTKVPEVAEEIPTTPQTASQLQATIDMKVLNVTFLTLVNIDRVANGSNELVYDADMQDEVDLRAADEASAVDLRIPIQVANFGIDHMRPDGSSWSSLLPYDLGGAENLLMNVLSASDVTYSVNEKELATLMFNQWKASSGHYANMLNSMMDSNAVSIQLLDKEGLLMYVASEMLAKTQ